jgi:hypothetical protein
MPLLLIVNEDRVVAVILIRLGQTVLLHQLALSTVADGHSPLSIVSRGNRKILLEVVFCGRSHGRYRPDSLWILPGFALCCYGNYTMFIQLS